MLVGLIFFGILLGGASGVAALLLGSSFWIALLIYSTIGAASILGFGLIFAFQAESAHRGKRPDLYVLADTQRS